jgi:prepilin-type N-terminal cleavage/methylation domain-containing protein
VDRDRPRDRTRPFRGLYDRRSNYVGNGVPGLDSPSPTYQQPVTMQSEQPHLIVDHRRGITLLEVLIAIGILAIGLSSVIALVPAGRSQASRAVVLDRASTLAANAVSDAVTFGFLRRDSLTNFTGLVVVDPLGLPTIGGTAAPRQAGIFSSPTDPAAAAASQWLFAQGRDDLLFATGTSVDDQVARSDLPPLNVFSDGARAFQGRMSCIFAIRPPAAGIPGMLTAVVFHGRDPGNTTLSGLIENGGIDLGRASVGFASAVKPGVVVCSGSTPSQYRFHQVLSFSTIAATGMGLITFSTGNALLTGTHTLTVLPDSVGFAERTFAAEESGPYLQ